MAPQETMTSRSARIVSTPPLAATIDADGAAVLDEHLQRLRAGAHGQIAAPARGLEKGAEAAELRIGVARGELVMADAVLRRRR